MNKPEVMSKIGKTSKGRPTGSKNKNTIYTEQLRELFVNRAGEEWNELVKAEIRDAKKNYRARHYIFDQVIGKSKESIELDTRIEHNISDGVIETINKIYGNK
jgi:hypothetical protein